MKLKKKSKSNFIILIVFLIIINTILLLNFFNNKINNRIIDITQTKINRLIDKIVLNNINNYFEENDYSNLLIINKKANGEISDISFETDKVYKVLLNTINNINKEVQLVNTGNINKTYQDSMFFKNSKGLVLEISFGNASPNFLFSNLGPKIPVGIDLASSMLANLSTNVRDYGINNILVELYLNLDITSEIITIKSEEISKHYSYLLYSKIAAGKVPEAYGGVLTQNTPVISN